ncbi:MAG: hypothetical protein HS108_04710 [Planctomycetes bacterium]|nr:hypothetical protein [Planctomycetota bacterium]MCL4730645.1 hypothetical protein [Planctomycetota bacterium]
MIVRVLAIAAATLRESTRSAPVRLAALLLLLCVPVMAWLVGDGEDGRVWAARTFTVEGLRLVLPLAAAVGGAFVLRPAARAGWALLPARRGEWFAGAALAGLGMILLSTALFVSGAVVMAPGESARVVRPVRATGLVAAPGTATGAASPADRHWADPNKGQALTFAFVRPDTAQLAGEVEFELVWTQEAAPARGVPFDVYVLAPGSEAARVKAEARSLSRRRASFSAAMPAGDALHVQLVPNDPVLIVGVAEQGIFLDGGRVSPLPGILWLALLAVAAAALCMAVSLWFRSWSTAPTAALAGLLLLAALTLLPGIAPTGRMAADRRAAVESDKDAMQVLESAAAQLPELLPSAAFDAYLRGREVVPTPGEAARRGLIALALLPLGAVTFRRRQIAR